MDRMEKIPTPEGREVWLTHLARPFKFESSYKGEMFTLMIVAPTASIYIPEIELLAREIIRLNCRSVLIVRPDATRLREIFLHEFFDQGKEKEEPFLLAT